MRLTSSLRVFKRHLQHSTEFKVHLKCIKFSDLFVRIDRSKMTDILEMSHQNVENVDPELNYNASETGQNVIDPEDKPDIDEKRQRRNVEYYGKRLTEVRK